MNNFSDRVQSAASFLAALFGGYESGFVEVRAFCKTGGNVAKRQFFQSLPMRSPEPLAKELVMLSDRNFDVYVGVLPRKEKRGVADAVVSARWVWADLDAKCMSPVRIAEAVADADMIVQSGYGTHAYWQLTQERELLTGLQREKFVRLVRRAQSSLSNGAADDVSDLPRILRVPGTWNWKRGEKVPVVLERCPVISLPVPAEENSPIGDEEGGRLQQGVKEMMAAAEMDALPALHPAWRNCRGMIVNDPNVWLRGQVTWLRFMKSHQQKVRALDDFEESVRRGKIVDSCLDDMTEDFCNLFLELERRGFNVLGFRNNPLFRINEVERAA